MAVVKPDVHDGHFYDLIVFPSIAYDKDGRQSTKNKGGVWCRKTGPQNMKQFFSRIMQISLCLILTLSCTQALAFVVPTEQSEEEVNGKQVLKQIYEVPRSMNPESLRQDNLEQNGFCYRFISIVQEDMTHRTSKKISQTYSTACSTGDTESVLKILPASIPYDESGFTGEMYLVPQTITIQATKYVDHQDVISETKQYTFEYNDPTLIPQTIEKNGTLLVLQGSPTWVEGPADSDTGVSTSYTATAVYAKTVTTSVPSEYSATAHYSGTAEKVDDSMIRYTLTYYGEPIGRDWVEVFRIAGLTLLAIIALVLIVILSIKLLGFLRSQFVTVQALNETTGDYFKLQTSHLREKRPVISINVLKAPSTRHFLVTLTGKCATRMHGKIITVQAGKRTLQHQVGECYAIDYSFTVDLDEIPV